MTFGVYRFWRAYIDGCSALGVVYEVSLEVVMTGRMHDARETLALPSGERVSLRHT